MLAKRAAASRGRARATTARRCSNAIRPVLAVKATVGELRSGGVATRASRSCAPAPASLPGSFAEAAITLRGGFAAGARCVRHRRRRRRTTWRVGAAEPERADPGQPRAVRRARARAAVGTRERQRRPSGMCGLGSREVQVRRDLAVLQRQRRLDQAGDAGGRLQVADVGLDRADRQRRPAAAGRRRARRRAPRLDRVAERRAGAVRLDVADLGRATRRPSAAPSRSTASWAGRSAPSGRCCGRPG